MDELPVFTTNTFMVETPFQSLLWIANPIICGKHALASLIIFYHYKGLPVSGLAVWTIAQEPGFGSFSVPSLIALLIQNARSIDVPHVRLYHGHFYPLLDSLGLGRAG